MLTDPYSKSIYYHRKQKERQHRDHHNKRRCARPERSFEYEKKRNADERATSEAEQLSFREIEQEFRLDVGKVFGNRNICQIITSFTVLRQASAARGFRF